MIFLLTKQTKSILLLALVAALLGGVFYGGYRCWQANRTVPEPQEPIEEKAYEIIDNPDGTKTFYNYAYRYRFMVPEGWETPEALHGDLDYIHFSDHLTLSDLGVTNIHIRAGFKELDHDCSTRTEPIETTITIAGQNAKRCDFEFQFSNFSEIQLTNADVGYAILIELNKPFDEPDIQTILNSFEFLEEK